MRSFAIVAILFATVAAPRAAGADNDAAPGKTLAADDAPHRARPSWFLAGDLAMRIAAVGGRGFRDDLEAYGYERVGHVGVGGELLAGWRDLPLIDIGLRLGYDYARVADIRKTELTMRSHAVRAAGFARLRFPETRRGVEQGLRFELGVTRTHTILRGETARDASPHVAAFYDFFTGGDLGFYFRLGYLHTLRRARAGEHLGAPATDGVVLGLGMFRRF